MASDDKQKVFSQKQQIDIDEYLKDLKKNLVVVHADQIVYPNIPTLQPKDIDSIRLFNNQSKSNYLPTALASFCLFDNLINIILGVECQESKANYNVFFWEMGKKTKVKICDKIIVEKGEGGEVTPLFQNSKGVDIWAYFFEKVLAQSVGLYSSIRYGNVWECIYNFVGCEYEVYWVSENITWKIQLKTLIGSNSNVTLQNTFSENDKRNHQFNTENSKIKQSEYITNDFKELRKIICLSSNAWGYYTEENKDPQDYYSYIILDAKKIQTTKKDNKTNEKPDNYEIWVKLLRIDNISYLKSSMNQKWSKNQIEKLGAQTQVSKGFCWVPYTDIIRKFKVISINTFRYLPLKPDQSDGSNYLKVTLDGNHSCVLLHFEVYTNEDKVLIGLHQKHKQAIANLIPDYKYSNFRLFLLKLKKEDISKAFINKNIIDKDAKIFDELDGNVVSFESMIYQNDNQAADNFIRKPLTTGIYILALEIFWEQTHYQNINFSVTSFNGDKINLRLFSMGTNFDVMIYKAFLNFYLNTYQLNNKRKIVQKVQFEPETLKVPEQIEKVIKREKALSSLEYVEVMESFYILYGGIAQNTGEICLKMNPNFIQDCLIRAPELISQLNNNDITSYDIVFNEKRSLIFLIVRTNLSSKYQSKNTINIDKYFSDAIFTPTKKNIFFSDDHLMALYYEKFLFSKQLIGDNSYVLKCEEQIFNEIVKEIYSSQKEVCVNDLNAKESTYKEKDLNSYKNKFPMLCYQYGISVNYNGALSNSMDA